MARVVFDDAVNLGVDRDGYRIGRVIDVPLGEKVDIVAYNGDTTGPITFTLGFSDATFLSVMSFLLPIAVLNAYL